MLNRSQQDADVTDISSLVDPNDVARTAPRFPDRVTLWPLEGDRCGVDVTYDGATGYELASRHEASLEAACVSYSFRQELGGAWTIRLTVPAAQVATVVARFVGDA